MAELKAVHRGAGSYSVMRGDEEIVEKLTKADAAEFNALSDAEKEAFVAEAPEEDGPAAEETAPNPAEGPLPDAVQDGGYGAGEYQTTEVLPLGASGETRLVRWSDQQAVGVGGWRAPLSLADLPEGYFIRETMGRHSARWQLYRGDPAGEHEMIADYDSEGEAVQAALA